MRTCNCFADENTPGYEGHLPTCNLHYPSGCAGIMPDDDPPAAVPVAAVERDAAYQCPNCRAPIGPEGGLCECGLELSPITSPPVPMVRVSKAEYDALVSHARAVEAEREAQGLSATLTDDERKAMLQLVQCFEVYPAATGLSHLAALLIRDAAKGRRGVV